MNKFFDNIFSACGESFFVLVSVYVAAAMIFTALIAVLIMNPIIVGPALIFIFFGRVIYAGVTGK